MVEYRGQGNLKGCPNYVAQCYIFMTTYPLVFEESVERYAAKTHVRKDCKHFGG